MPPNPMTNPQLTLYVPGSNALVLSLDNADTEELLRLFNKVEEDSKFYCIKQELDKITSDQWFKDHAARGSRPYY